MNYNYKGTEIINRYTMDSDNTPTDIGDSDNGLKVQVLNIITIVITPSIS